MHLLKTTMFFVIALSTAVMAKSTPRGGKELLRQLVLQKPWDIAELAHIVQLEWHYAVNAADYVPNALRLLQQLVVEIPREEQVQKLLLWEITPSPGKRHWLLGTWHYFSLDDFSAPAQQTLHELLLRADMLIHEGSIPQDEAASVASHQMLDHQLIAKARQMGTKTAPLESPLEAAQAKPDRQRIRAEYQSRLNARIDTMSDTEMAILLSTRLEELEISFRRDSAYVQGDSAILQELLYNRIPLQERRQDEAGLVDKLLHTPNQSWITKITTACQQNKTCLISAGYQHLLFDDESTTSLITLLRAYGYHIAPKNQAQ